MTMSVHWRSSTLFTTCASMLLALLATGSSIASTITVSRDGTGDYASIQDAIDAAANEDVILVEPGTYFGKGESVIDFKGKSITLRSVQGSGVTVVDAEDARRAIALVNSSDVMQVVSIEGFTIKRGLGVAHDYDGDGKILEWEQRDGGGMLCVSAQGPGDELVVCALVDCIFQSNNARSGAGVYGMAGALTFSDCEFNGNSAEEDGGGVHAKGGTSSLALCSFTGNHAARGAGIHSSGEATLNGCFFNDNEASVSGGGFQDDGAASTLANCIFNGNTTEGDGGGLHTSASSVLDACIFEENEAGSSGGGVCVLKESPFLTGCTFKGNQANGGMNTDVGNSMSHGGGGGLRNFQGHPQLVKCVFEDNTALNGVGGGMSSKGTGADALGMVTLLNSTFTSNHASEYGGGIYNGPFGRVVLTRCALEHNSAGARGGGIYSDINDDVDRVDGNSENDGNAIVECSWICGNSPGHIEGPWTDLLGNTLCSECEECQTSCPADLNGDGLVDGADLAMVLSAWGVIDFCVQEDLNRDGFANGGDLAVLLGSWGECP